MGNETEDLDKVGGRLLALAGSPSQYIKLNVGGALYQTTISTLTKHDSMLRAMFSGRNEVLTDVGGWVLIDRSGKHFGTILNFLRDGYVPLPECRVETAEILAEAKYYLIQDLVQLCQNWLKVITKEDVEPLGICKVPLVNTKKDCDRIMTSTTKPVIKLLINRHNNKYSYTSQSDDNFMKNLELFDRLVTRFNDRVLFIKDIGAENAEVCQWTFFGQGRKKAEICCTSIVYATDKKQTKVEFPEARIYEEAMNVLLFEERHICIRCGGEGGSCSPPRGLSSSQLQLPPFVYSSHSASVSPQCTSPALFAGDVPGTSGQDDRRRISRLVDGRSNSLVVTTVSDDTT
ncbi:BTB/POZ domain-containing adapter [Onchocerca flexuosa]|uniref:BTB/POZ domain-containing adapter n=2 Tax=Onchocerca flexuosa TaxID=387005 RepID=A0A238BSU6_9BILA|nr:BTB/POZ domain-containing adapter [Onchocerca flexuosa]